MEGVKQDYTGGNLSDGRGNDRVEEGELEKVNGAQPFDAGQYSFFGDLGDGDTLEGELGGLEDGVEVPPEEEIIKEEPLDILEELRDDDIEDLSYATMFANALQLENRTQASEAMPMNDPIVERPTPYLAGQAASLAITMDGTPEHAHAFHQESRGYAAEAPSAQFLMGAPGMMTDYCSPGLPGLNLSAQIQNHASSHPSEMKSSSLSFASNNPLLMQSLLGQQGDAISRPRGPMTVEELEAQMLSKQRNQIQQSLQHLQSAAPGYLPAPPSVPFPMPPPPHMLAVPPGSFQPGALPPPMLGHAAGSNVTCEPTVPSGIGPAGEMHIPGPRPPLGPPPPMPIPGPPGHLHPSMLQPGTGHLGGPMPGIYGSPGRPPPPRPFHGNGRMPDGPALPRGMPSVMGIHPQPLPAWGPRPPPLLPPHLYGRGPGGPPHFMQPQQGHFPAPGSMPPRPSREVQYGNGMLVRRRQYGSKCMSADEIEQIMRIQWKSLHSGSPYQEDYYYQAYVFKHRSGRNLGWFAPDRMREIGPTEKVGMEQTAFAKLEGLGKIPFSNIRRPRPLMDLEPTQPKEEEDGEGDKAAGRRRLEDEPLLAARIVVEDCLCLLLDVDDIDRMWAASDVQRDNKASLRKRRALLVKAVTRNLRVPESPRLASEAAAGDGVFLRLMALPKGRGMLTRALRLLHAPPSLAEAVPGGELLDTPRLQIAWALLRNLRTLFGRASTVGMEGTSRTAPTSPEILALAAQHDIEVTSNLANSAGELMKRLNSPGAVNECMEAMVAGDLVVAAGSGASRADSLLPLYVPGERAQDRRVWLADVLVALLQRAQELGLADYAADRQTTRDGVSAAEGKAWHTHFESFYKLVFEHISTLVEVFTMATSAGATEAAEYARQIAPVNLIRAILPHATDAQRDELRNKLAIIS